MHVSHLLKTLPWTFNKSGFYAQGLFARHSETVCQYLIPLYNIDFEAFLIQDDVQIQLDQKKKICEYGIQNQVSTGCFSRQLFAGIGQYECD